LDPMTENTVLYNYRDEVGRMEYDHEHGLIERDLIIGLIDAKSRERFSSGKVKQYVQIYSEEMWDTAIVLGSSFS
jgi:hypothetical protein